MANYFEMCIRDSRQAGVSGGNAKVGIMRVNAIRERCAGAGQGQAAVLAELGYTCLLYTSQKRRHAGLKCARKALLQLVDLRQRPCSFHRKVDQLEQCFTGTF